MNLTKIRLYSTQTWKKYVVPRVVLNFFTSNSSNYRIIKCVCFKPIHCAINLDATSFSKVFNEFDYVFMSELI